MKLLLTRFERLERATIGLLCVDGKFFCFTLEDKVQQPKIPGETAIPAGTYEIQIQWSPKFQRNMPHLQNVPEFEGVLIHWGNTDVDTEGCILVGRSHFAGEDLVGQSKLVFDALFQRMTIASEEMQIEIREEFA